VEQDFCFRKRSRAGETAKVGFAQSIVFLIEEMRGGGFGLSIPCHSALPHPYPSPPQGMLKVEET